MFARMFESKAGTAKLGLGHYRGCGRRAAHAPWLSFDICSTIYRTPQSYQTIDAVASAKLKRSATFGNPSDSLRSMRDTLLISCGQCFHQVAGNVRLLLLGA